MCERQIRERDMLEGERLVWETGEQARQLTVRQVRERDRLESDDNDLKYSKKETVKSF